MALCYKCFYIATEPSTNIIQRAISLMMFWLNQICKSGTTLCDNFVCSFLAPAAFLCFSSSLSGPQWRDKLTLPQSLFVSFIPTETFQRERSVNIHHRKTGVWPPHRPLHSAVIFHFVTCLVFYLGLSALLFIHIGQHNEVQCLVFGLISSSLEQRNQLFQD